MEIIVELVVVLIFVVVWCVVEVDDFMCVGKYDGWFFILYVFMFLEVVEVYC